MNYIMLDLEWNQPFKKEQALKKPVKLNGEIIQIGAVKTDENFNIIDTFKILIEPVYYKKMNSKVKKLTKITNKKLKTGLPFEEALEQFKNWCGSDFTFITWGNDDIPILEANLILHGKSKKWVKKHYDAQAIFDYQVTKEGRQIALSEAMGKIGQEPFEAHDALNDAKSTAVICSSIDMKSGLTDYKLIKKPKEKKKKHMK